MPFANMGIQHFFPNSNLKDVKERDKLAQSIMSEINCISGLCYENWSFLIDFIKIFPKQISTLLKPNYHKIISERWGENIFREEFTTHDLTLSIDPKIGENHKNIASQMRKKKYYENLDPFTVENLNMFPKPEFRPIVFEEIHIQKENEKRRNMRQIGCDEKEHLFIFVHGYQGSSFDMRLIRNHLCWLMPTAMYLCSSANEDSTEGDIESMGKNLAYEIKYFIKDHCNNDPPKRISFIAHSLGGLICRAALPFLHEYKKFFYTFISLSSPHLGMYNSSKLIDAGIWILKQWKKSVCLQEMSMTDKEKIEDTYLFQLSKKQGLCWFQNIGLFSSHQDQYVPFDSARIQRNASSNNNK